MPHQEKRTLPVQLSGFDAPTVNTYSLETTVAEKLDAILTTLNLQMSVKALERYISRNINPVGKFNKLIKLLGLRNAYRVYKATPRNS